MTTPQPRKPVEGPTPVGPPWLRAAGVAAGWLLVGATLFAATFAIDLHHNLFTWEAVPVDWTLDTGVGIGTVVALVFCWWLSRRTLRVWQLVIGGLVAALLVVLGIALTPVEEVNPGLLLGRDRASPWWYRWGRLGVLTMPALFLLVRRPWRRAAGGVRADVSARP